MSNTAWKFEHSVDCNANRSFAWSFWTDISNWERLEGDAVEWIRLDGPFAEGTAGETKMPGQEPNHWQITQLEPEVSATIAMSLPGAAYHNRMVFEALGPDSTRIRQIMSLSGEQAAEMAPGMKMFEQSAPQGLEKLARQIEVAYGAAT